MRSKVEVEDKLLSEYSHTSPLIQEIHHRLESSGQLGINIGNQEGFILGSLCALPHVEKVVEIGTQYGCSATWMAQSLGPRGRIYTIEKDPKHFEESRRTFSHPDFTGTGCQVESLLGDARELLPKLVEQGPFDLIFIDANKSAYGDYQTWAKQNVVSGGLLVFDNIYLFGSLFLDECPPETPKKMWQVMKSVIRSQFQDPEFSTSIIPTKEGLMVSVKK